MMCQAKKNKTPRKEGCMFFCLKIVLHSVSGKRTLEIPHSIRSGTHSVTSTPYSLLSRKQFNVAKIRTQPIKSGRNGITRLTYLKALGRDNLQMHLDLTSQRG